MPATPPPAPGPAADLPAAASGLSTLPSAHGVGDTLDRLEALLNQKGVHIFTRVDHGAGAAQAGLALRPTQVLLFGDPRAGTPLMQARQTIGIDLPLKALAWEDEAGRTWLTYNQPQWLAQRHHLQGQEGVVQAMAAGVEALARAATAP